MLTQPESSELLRVSSPESHLLAGVNPDVVEILGADRILKLEALSQGLEWFDGVIESDNPFTKPRDGEPDLSFMEPKQAGRIMDAYEAGSSPEAVADRIHSRSLSSLGVSLELTRLMDLGDEAQVALCRHLNASVDQVAEVKSAAQKLIHEPDERMSIDQVVELSDQMNLLAVHAELFPSDGTYEAIKAVLRMAKEMLKVKSNHTSLPTDLLVEFKASYGVAQILANVDRAYHHQGAMLRYGAETYERLRDEMTRQKSAFTSDLLREAANAKTFLDETTGGLDESQIGLGLLAEEYILGKIAIVEKVVQDLNPRVLTKPAVIAELQRLRTFRLSQAEQDRIARQEEEVSRDLSTRVTLARDILRGGGRLQARNGDNPGEITEGLKQFFRDKIFAGMEIRDPKYSGLIVSLVTGKFDTFIRTLAELKAEDTNGVVAIVARTRAAIIEELQGFDIDGAMHVIRSLTSDPAHMHAIVSTVLTPNQLTKLELGVEKYFEERE